MAVIDVVNNNGSKVSQVDLNDAVFNVLVNKELLHQVIIAQLSKRRSGTASVKRRSDIVGSGRKLYRQKGTGRARKGNIKSPILRGGGVVFGPNPRSYTKKILKKVAKSAIKMALTSKFVDQELVIIDSFELSSPKTRLFVNIMKRLGVKDSLIVSSGENNYLGLSSRNVQGVKLLNYKGINVLDILKYSNLIIDKNSLKRIERKLR